MKLKVKQDLPQVQADPNTREARTLDAFKGAFFTKGDEIEVTDAQAAALLAVHGEHFSKVRAPKTEE